MQEVQKEPIYKQERVFVGNHKFYPIHMNQDEINTIIFNLLDLVNIPSYSESVVIGQFRKDKGGKGVDIRIDVYDRHCKEASRQRRYTLGINGNWEVADFFDHWIFYHSDGAGNIVEDSSCQQLLYPIDLGIDEIIQKRRKEAGVPKRFFLFDKEEWTAFIPRLHD